jgi:hypothetical protein
MTRFRLVLVAAIVAAVGWNLLHHGQKWTTYHDATYGWTIERPAKAKILPAPQAVIFSDGKFSLTVRDAGRTKRRDTRLPLDPVDFLPGYSPSKGTTLRSIAVVAHHRAFAILAITGGSHDQATAFKMLRSLRFS